tara:strand:+ start:157 stop:1182 length:1026 start_codon:yes stop_codon:yes gene_type:complete
MTDQHGSLVIVDCGQNTATLLHPQAQEVETLSHKDLFKTITSLPAGTHVVSEEAHLGTPRRGLSKSQPFTEQELLPFYAKCKERGIDLSFFPQQSTFRAQQYYRTKHNLSEEDFPKSDENDPLALRELLTDFPEISLSQPKENFDENPVRVDGNAYKQSLNEHLNYARASDPKPYNYSDDGCRKWIDKNIEEVSSSLSLSAQKVFNLTEESRYKKTGEINLNKIKMTQFYSVVASLIDYEGRSRCRLATGALPGWKFIKQFVFSMSPFHRRGGVARSNLYHHGVKNYYKMRCEEEGRAAPPRGGRGVFSKKQDDFLVQCRNEYCAAVRELFQTTRDILSPQ